MSAQLEIPDLLFAPQDYDDDPAGMCIEWLCDVRGCTDEVRPYVMRLFAEFPRCEAFDRAKAFTHLCGDCAEVGWTLADAKLLGVYDHYISYHTLWDRCWAIHMLVPRELVPQVWKCGYGNRPKFFDAGGGLLFESVYSRDGHVLTRDERRAALAGDAT